MAFGGFNGSDPSPTLEQFQRYVGEGKIHYFVGGRRDACRRREQRVGADRRVGRANFTAVTVDGTTLYDLTGEITG